MSSTPTSANLEQPYTQSKGYEEIANWIATEIARILEIDVRDVNPDQEFSAFGVDSMAAFAMTGELCEWLGRDLPATLLWEYPTIASLSRHIADGFGEGNPKMSAASNSVLLSDGDKQSRLFCICGIDLYQNLADELNGMVDAFGVYVPPEKSLGKFGKDLDERYEYVTVEALAARYVEEILTVDPNGPYHLVGLSFGGVLAFEAAQQLRSRGAEVPLLVLLDSVLPGAVTVRAYRHVIGLIKDALSQPDTRETAPEEGTEELSYDQMVQFRGRYYWTLAKQYEPSPYSGSVQLVRATASRLFGRGYIHDEHLGWENLVTGDFEIVRINATHTGILEAPLVSELAAALRARLPA